MTSLLLFVAYIVYEKIIGDQTTGNYSTDSHYLPVLFLLPQLVFCVAAINASPRFWKIFPILALIVSLLLALLMWFIIALSNWSSA